MEKTAEKRKQAPSDAPKKQGGSAKRPAARQKSSAKQKPSAKQRWKLVFTVILMLAWVFASVIVAQFIVGHIMLAIIGAENFAKPVSTAIYSALSYLLAMGLIMLAPAICVASWRVTDKKGRIVRQGGFRGSKITRNSLGLRGLPTWTDIGLAPVGFIVYMLLAAGITAVFSLFPWFDASKAQDVGFSIYSTGADRVIAFITLVVVAPIAEEIIFRGWLYGKLREKFKGQMPDVAGMLLAILLVSVLFGVVHLQWNVGVNVFALSVVLCGLREITGTIYAEILLHMVKNGLAFYLVYVLGVG